ncbi:hypothetical protein HG264_13055 [Pseudomonas sp. gcc21]|uniref:hypothetical protein n=1 Tax=Pseudomonas sp. gcc21 TaxID=2726989 RepID=UPI0014519C9C|nr:hypothetical protein [Pseudomonas sp. gcc21]QJD59766.1 hypothetical protein HG264_13055 [Pseudomonas sp. gcc21]
MQKYIDETKFATSSLIDLIWEDFASLENLNAELKRLTAEFNVKYQVFMANEFHPAANYYHAQMAKVAQPKRELENHIKEVSQSIDAKSVSIAALSGALLQIAKQCISLRYGKPQNAPDGENIGGVLVKDIIFEGRNQSIHYENPKEISVNVINLFGKLDAIRNDGVVWDARSQVNFAFEIVRLLGWRTHNDFVDHLKSIKSKKSS